MQVLGQMTSSVTEILNFVQVSETLWNAPSSEPSSGGTSNADSKLVGEHSWPFLLNLPNACQVQSRNGSTETFALPASFSERMARVHIQYQVIVTVHRSRFRVDSTYVPSCAPRSPPSRILMLTYPLPRSLGTVVGYLPIIRPGPPSMARQLAYLQNTPLPGPDDDPDGWHSLDPLHVRGSVFSTREVTARCTVRPHAVSTAKLPFLSERRRADAPLRPAPPCVHTVRARQTSTSPPYPLSLRVPLWTRSCRAPLTPRRPSLALPLSLFCSSATRAGARSPA